MGDGVESSKAVRGVGVRGIGTSVAVLLTVGALMNLGVVPASSDDVAPTCTLTGASADPYMEGSSGLKPHGIVADPGTGVYKMWFAELGAGAIGSFDASTKQW